MTCLQLCVAAGANVYVSSGDQTKINRAVELGAKGGVSYKDSALRRTPSPSSGQRWLTCMHTEDWPAQLAQVMKKDGVSLLNAVIDAGGGDIMAKTSNLLKQGGRLVVFGM